MNTKLNFLYIVLLAFVLFATPVNASEGTDTVIIPEDLASCTAGIDNDLDGLAGFLGDEDCDLFVVTETSTSTATTTATTTEPVATTTSETATTNPVVAPVVVPPTSNGGFSGPSFGSGPATGGFSGGITSGTPISTVISSSTLGTCADVFTTYMRKGKTNNVTEVTRLQRILGVKQTGFFGTLTQNAVNAFQLKYSDNVLRPWGINYATGYFYKTTQRQMNMLLCPTVDFPMPVLN